MEKVIFTRWRGLPFLIGMTPPTRHRHSLQLETSSPEWSSHSNPAYCKGWLGLHVSLFVWREPFAWVLVLCRFSLYLVLTFIRFARSSFWVFSLCFPVGCSPTNIFISTSFSSFFSPPPPVVWGREEELAFTALFWKRQERHFISTTQRFFRRPQQLLERWSLHLLV